MDAEGLVSTEAPVDSGFESTAESTPTVDESTETQTETTEAPPATVDGKPPEGETQPTGRPVIDGKLSPSFKPVLEKLKAEAPQVAKAIQNALFFEDRLRRELPGGIKELQELRGHVEQLGGADGIQELTGELDGWRGFDEQYSAGDPKILEFLTETPEASAAFLKIAPAAFEKFRDLNPEGYGAYVSQVFLADLHQEGIPLALERLGDLIPQDNPKALQLLQALQGYVKRIGGLAAKSIAPKATERAPQDDARAKELETRESNLTRQEWSGESAKQHGKIFTDAWKRLASHVPADKAGLVRRLYKDHLQEKLATKKDFDSKMGRYFGAKDKNGFLRMHDATFREVVPLALRAAMLEAGLASKPAVPAAKPGETKPAAPGVKASPAAGYTLVNAKPAMATVDRVNTTSDMWTSGKAVLRDGKKVTWRS